MAVNIYGATSLIGGGTGALDAINGNVLNDGDGALVYTSDSMYFYRLDATSGASESVPEVIAPDSNPGTKRWLIQSMDLPMSEVYGCELSNNSSQPNDDIDISVGKRRSDDDTTNMILSSILVKQIDATWAEGTNQGGLDTGTVANDTEYHVYLIYNPTTDTVDVLFTVTYGSPTMPSGYTKKRILGSIYTASASTNILGFSQEGDSFLWDDPPLDVDVSDQGASAVTRTLTVATGRKVHAVMNVFVSGANRTLYISSLDADDEAPSDSVAPLRSFVEDNTALQTIIRTNTSGQVRTRADGTSTTVKIATLSWIDSRGKDN